MRRNSISLLFVFILTVCALSLPGCGGGSGGGVAATTTCPAGQNLVNGVCTAPQVLGRVEGYVRNPYSSDQSGVTVVLEPQSGAAGRAVSVERALTAGRILDRTAYDSTTLTTTTDSNGHFAVTNVPPGRYVSCAISAPNVQNPNCSELSTRPDKYNPDNGLVSILPVIEVPAGASSTVEIGDKDPNTGEVTPGFVMKKVGMIRGSAKLSGGTNHQGILCYIPGTSFMAMTDSNGDYTIYNVPEGKYDLTCQKTNYQDGLQTALVVTESQTTVIAAITLSASPTSCSISVTKMTASPETIYEGATSAISVETASSNCADLVYTYTPADGVIFGSGSSVTWAAPNVAGLYTIYVTVTDGTRVAAYQRPVLVVKSILPSITINTITPSPQEVFAGATSTITASVTYTGNGNLTYTWTTSAGATSGTGASVTYTAPGVLGGYIIYLTVSDGAVSAKSMANVFVKETQQETPEVSFVEFNGRTISAYDASNYFRWKFTANSTITSALVTDVDGDGKKEVVVGTDRDGDDKGVVYLINKTGNVIWSYKTGGTGVYQEDDQFSVNALFVEDVNGDSKKEVISVSSHYLSFPSRICVISDTGTLQGSYWNPGKPLHVVLFDIDGDGKKEIIAGGGNDDYQNKAFVFVLDGENVVGELEAPPDKGLGTGGADKQKCYKDLPAVGTDNYVSSLSIVATSTAKIKADGPGYTYYLDSNCTLLNPPANNKVPPAAAASASKSSGDAPLTVYFTGKCTDIDGTCVSLLWNFGDGTPTSVVQNPTHTFLAAGIYNVTLTVTDNDGGTDTKTIAITVSENQAAVPQGIGLRVDIGGTYDMDGAVFPAIVKLPDGSYRMYYCGFTGNSSRYILSAVSTDGMTWTKESGKRLEPFSGYQELAYPDVVKLQDGTYRMYFTAYNPGWNIHSAVSADGLVWQVEDGVRLSDPPLSVSAIVKNEDGTYYQYPDGKYRMYYHKNDGSYFIGSAASTDGLTWVNEGPRIQYGGTFDMQSVGSPNVVILPNGTFKMFYFGRGGIATGLGQIYGADSQDGLTWTKDNGFLLKNGTQGVYDNSFVQAPYALIFGDNVLIYYSGYDASSHYRILSVSYPTSQIMKNR